MIVVPKTVELNWAAELNKWGHFLISNPRYDPNCFQNLKKGRLEIVIAGCNQVQKYIELFANIDWGIIIFDEGHSYLRNPTTFIYKSIEQLKKSDFRLMLTGTPVQNDLEDLWYIMNIVTGGTFYDLDIYKSHFINPIKKSTSRIVKDS